jgi:hypothetical protein
VGVRDDLIDLVEFRTNKFAPFLPDDSQVNPGVYGREILVEAEIPIQDLPGSLPG